MGLHMPPGPALLHPVVPHPTAHPPAAAAAPHAVRQKVEQRGLARAGAAHNVEEPPWVGREGDVAKQGLGPGAAGSSAPA